MTDAEISRRLALAIGWKCSDVRTSKYGRYITVPAGPFNMRRQFDYRDPAVIWPISERFDCFPEKMRSGGLWAAPVSGMKTGERPAYPMLRWEYADTAAKAAALAVIKAHGGAKE